MAKEVLQPWMGFFKHILDQPLPIELTSQTANHAEIERRDRCY